MASNYKQKQRKKLIVAIVCCVLVFALLAATQARQTQRKADIVQHGARVQKIEMLKHHANGLPELAQFGLAIGRDVLAINQHPPSVWHIKALNQFG